MAGMVLAVFAYPLKSHADTVEDMRKMIEQKNQEIQQLEAEAAKYKQEIASKQQEGKSLKNELTRIEATINSLLRDISLTQAKIQRAQLEITETESEITIKQASALRLKGGLSNLLRIYSQAEKTSPLAILLGTSQISEFFRILDFDMLVRQKMMGSISDLKIIENELEIKKSEAEAKRDESAQLKQLLSARQAAMAGQKKDRTQLLAVTKQQEAAYQQLLAEQQKKKESLQNEIQDIETKIKITIDASALPSKGTGVLAWPLPDLSLRSCGSSNISKNCITQFFGYTSFAAAGGYGGKGHNGDDFRADVGTSVLSAEKGTIAGVGDTDAGCKGASYGKWVLINHTNNLSTLYGHMSQINVTKGQPVSRGQLIGLSGKTGYATGPHLHFTVYATQGVQIDQIKSKVCGTLMTLPIAPVNAYLNPLDYL